MYTAVLTFKVGLLVQPCYAAQCPRKHDSACARTCRVDINAMVPAECAQELYSMAVSGMCMLCVSLSSVP